MRTSQIRNRILADHAYLRDLLGELDRQAHRVLEGALDEAEALRKRGLELHARLGVHLAFEDRWLAPALRSSGLSGQERARQLADDHREQRELLDYILGRLQDPERPSLVVASEMRSLVELLLDDMAYEELTILDACLPERDRAHRTRLRSAPPPMLHS